jgi:hypothetical protein
MLARMAGGKACRPQFVRIAEFFPGANFGGQAARAVAGEVPAAGLALAAQGALRGDGSAGLVSERPAGHPFHGARQPAQDLADGRRGRDGRNGGSFPTAKAV